MRRFLEEQGCGHIELHDCDASFMLGEDVESDFELFKGLLWTKARQKAGGSEEDVRR